MDWMKQVSEVLDRYGDVDPVRPPVTVDTDFDVLAQQAPPEAISEGLSAAFRSDHTPEFPQMASQLFGRASGSQRAGMLNALLAAVGPMVLQQILARRQRAPSPSAPQGGGLGGILGNILRGDGPPRVSPEVAEEIAQRTPAFSGWQQERWWTHCHDAAEFLGVAGRHELEARWRDVIPAIRAEAGYDDGEWAEYFAALDREHGPTAYVFRCRHCGQLGGYSDSH